MYESLLVLLTMYVDAFQQNKYRNINFEGIAPPKVGFLAGNVRTHERIKDGSLASWRFAVRACST